MKDVRKRSDEKRKDIFKKNIFVRDYTEAKWYDRHFRREVTKLRKENGRKRNMYAIAYDLAMEKGLI